MYFFKHITDENLNDSLYTGIHIQIYTRLIPFDEDKDIEYFIINCFYYNKYEITYMMKQAFSPYTRSGNSTKHW